MRTSAPRWLLVVLFALAMAWVESAVVVYLRTLVNRIEPYQRNPLPEHGALGGAELVREAATMIMIFTVGWLAGDNRRTRLAWSMVIFGLWDIFYYVFLKLICGWPGSLGDWDILFLLPLPWWGPIWAPMSIAVLMIAGGALVNQFESGGRPIWPGTKAWLLSAVGVVLALYVFMADALAVAGGGAEAIRAVLPVRFQTGLFVCALALMSVLVIDLISQVLRRKSQSGLSISTTASHPL